MSASSEATRSRAERTPTVEAPGLKVTPYVALPPTGSVPGVPPVSVKSPGLVPASVTLLMTSGVLPVFVTLTDCSGEVVPLTPEYTSSGLSASMSPLPAVMTGCTLRTIITASWKSTPVGTSSGAMT